MDIVRGSTLYIRSRFWSHGDDVQPSSAHCTLFYHDLTYRSQTTIVTLTLGNDERGRPEWTGSWDTSVAGPGRADWVVQTLGPLKTADEGNFMIVANEANGVRPPCWPHFNDEFRG